MANTEKANEGAAKAKSTEAPKAGDQESETAAAAAAAADNGGASADGVTQEEIDKLKAAHAADIEQKVAAAEEKGYKLGLKDGGDNAVPTGSAIYTDKQIEALKADAEKQGYQDGLDALEVDEDDERVFRGALMEIILLIPANLRRIRPEARLQDMVDFLDQLTPIERNIAVPLIRSIALKEPDDIPSGRYKVDVLNALNVVSYGHSLDSVASDRSLDQGDAFARLQSVVANNPVPAGAAIEMPEGADPRLAGVPMSATDPDAAAQRLSFLTGGLAGGTPGKFTDTLQPE